MKRKATESSDMKMIENSLARNEDGVFKGDRKRKTAMTRKSSHDVSDKNQMDQTQVKKIGSFK